MVKLTIIGRVSDGLTLAQGPRYVNEEEEENDHDNLSILLGYKQQQQAEFILKEISTSALPLSNVTIPVDHHHSFNYVVGHGVCFITLCDSTYPRKLVHSYLQDLAKEFENFDKSLLDRITKPYSFTRFASIIGNFRRQYVDTRTQTNLSKLNAKTLQDVDFMTEELSQIVKRRIGSDVMNRARAAPEQISQIWGSKKLEVIALKGTPITLVSFVGAILLWTCLIVRNDLGVSGY